MTITRRWRRMTLHFSQIGLTLGRTFISCSLVAIGDPAPRQIVGRDLHLDTVSGQDADAVHSHLSRAVGEHFVPVLQLDSEHCVGKRLDNRPFEHDRVLFGLGQMILLRMRQWSGAAWEEPAGERPNVGRGLVGPGARAPETGSPPPAHRTRKTRSPGQSDILACQGTVSTSGPSSVMAMVCSKWAERWPSAVTTLQPSPSSRVPAPPT